MNCPICGSALDADALFCGACGFQLKLAAPGASHSAGTPGSESPCRSVGTSPRPVALSLARQFLCTLRQAAGDGRALLCWMRRPRDT